jgi:nucleotide-binding universal stress UspA family protein
VIAFKELVCPVDFSESSLRAFAHAAAIVRWYGAHLTVVHVAPFAAAQMPGGPGDPVGVGTPALREGVLDDLRRFLNLGTVVPEVSLVAESGDPRTAIVDQAVSKDADLIVMGTHGRRGFTRLLLGSVTESVLREAPCPVLTVPPRAAVAVSEDVTFKRILCPVDFSPSALQAMGFALDLARQANGVVTLLHVVEPEWLPEEGPQAIRHFNSAQYGRDIAADAEERLRLLTAGESRTWVDIDHTIVLGRAHREIIRAAETRHADLLVMGAQGRDGVDLALFGSTTQQVVRGATCPVLTVRARRESQRRSSESATAASVA